MDNVSIVFWILMAISTVGVLTFATMLATWGSKLVKANRPIRKERHESIPTYYGRLASAH